MSYQVSHDDNQETILELQNIELNFGGVKALDNVSFGIKKEVLAIIGPNGAGKTCTLNCLSSFYHPQQGRILFEGRDITRIPPHEIAKLGIARTFQNIELYTGLSVIDNLMAARHIHIKYNFLLGSLFAGPASSQEKKHRRVVEEIIDFLEIVPIRDQVVGTLPYGMRKRVELGRALALEPKVLLLDEPMAGMNLEEKEDIARFIIDAFEEKHIPIVLVEHDMGVVMDIADKIVVLDFGHKIAEGSPEEIKATPEVIKAYLG